MSDAYIEIEATLLMKTAKAILLKVEDVEGWVPRSCCHFITDQAIDEMKLNNAASFKIMAWVAERNGFI